jgi:hypothetical protein
MQPFMVPLARMINNFLADVHDDLQHYARMNPVTEDHQKNEKAAAIQTLAALDELRALTNDPAVVYDVDHVNARLLDAKLRPFTTPEKKPHLTYFIRERLSLLLSWMNTVSVVEAGGLKALNTELLFLMDEFASICTTDKYDEIRQAGFKIDQFLCSLIFVCPHIVRSIKIKLKNQLLSGDEISKRGHGGGGLSGHGRHHLEKLIERITTQIDDNWDRTLCIPLPYYFTTGTHGSGERAACGASNMVIEFDPAHDRDGKNYPAARVNITRAIISYDLCLILFEEIESIELSSDASYTPMLSPDFRDNCTSDELRERGNWVRQYLRFRDFCDMRNFRKPEEFPDIREYRFKYLNTHIWEPGFGSRLWNPPSWAGESSLTWAACAYMPDNGPETLFVFQGQKIESRSKQEAQVLRLMAEQLDEDRRRPYGSKGIEIYQGNEIVRVLFEHPFYMRNF